MTRGELTTKIKALLEGTVIPKPEAKDKFCIKGTGHRRGEEALVYTIPSHSEKEPKPYQKGVTFTEFFRAYTVLQETGEFTRQWFRDNLPECNKEGGCNFTTIGGIFELLGLCEYADRGKYVKV